MPIPIFASPPVAGSMIGLELLASLLSGRNKSGGRTPQDPRVNYPNYPGDPLDDLFSNPLIDYQKLFRQSPYLKGVLMNMGINPNLLTRQNIGGYSRPNPSYSDLGRSTSYPITFMPFTPAFIQNFSGGSGREFRPDSGFQLQSNAGGSGGVFGIAPLVNAPNPQPQVTLEELMRTLSQGQ